MMRPHAEDQGRRRGRLIGAVVSAGWLVCLAGGQAAGHEDLQPCPFSHEEVQAALERAVTEAQTSDMRLPEGREVACTYFLSDTSTVLAVRQTMGTVPSSEAALRSGRTRPVANDPDGAVWDLAQENAGGRGGKPPKVVLKYKHRGADTTLIVYGGYFAEPDMRGKVLRLKKVP